MVGTNLLSNRLLTGTFHNGQWPVALMDDRPYYAIDAGQMLCSPVDGSVHGRQGAASPAQIAQAVSAAEAAFLAWRQVPAPQRGELVRCIGERVRDAKQELAELITLEVGKISNEAEGEVQEWIDICDYAVGLSRQLHGLSLVSERPAHRLLEQWHPLGPVGVITAFNFPMAVWAWNAMLALVCGNSVVWKPSEKTPLCAIAAWRIVQQACADFNLDGVNNVSAHSVPANLVQVIFGASAVGHELARARELRLISATGSVAMGRHVALTVAKRLARSLLELGGNNAAIVTPSADLALVERAVAFSATGTCGQRCTSLRRLIVHHSLIAPLLTRLAAIYAQLAVADPRLPGTLIGPLIDQHAFDVMQRALISAQAQGGRLVFGGERIMAGVPEKGFYVRPALLLMPGTTAIVAAETFAPILYVVAYHTLEEAVALNNAVSQGLSSAIFTTDLRDAEYFLSAAGSDCGLANVNTGTSGAEIGGAFGGEKDTGGGRESGSDAWKNYMRRSTSSINYGNSLPLAQGVRFDV